MKILKSESFEALFICCFMMERLATWECQRQLRYFYVSNMRIFAFTAMDYSLSINNLINYILITATLHCLVTKRSIVTFDRQSAFNQIMSIP